ncbi:hypothetical protein STEG23_024527, partial [Scotinomys teguina]
MLPVGVWFNIYYSQGAGPAAFVTSLVAVLKPFSILQIQRNWYNILYRTYKETKALSMYMARLETYVSPCPSRHSKVVIHVFSYVTEAAKVQSITRALTPQSCGTRRAAEELQKPTKDRNRKKLRPEK